MLFDLLPIFSDACGSVLRYVVGSKLLRTERASAEATLVLVADMAPESLASCKICTAVSALMPRPSLSVVVDFGTVFGRNMAFQRGTSCKCIIAMLTSIHVGLPLNLVVVLLLCGLDLTREL